MERIFSMCLRVGELAFACVVAGLTGEYLHKVRNSRAWDKKRFIYTEIVAALSILLSLLWLLPFAWGFIHWPVDLLISIMWIVSFGLLVNFIGPMHCGSIWHWGDLTQKGTCQKWKADVAFAFLSFIFWLASAILGLYFMRRHRRTTKVDAAPAHRRRWYRRHHV